MPGVIKKTKQMKKNLLLIAMAAGLFSCLSCKKILNVPDLSAISGSQVWGNTNTAYDFVYQTYSDVLGYQWTGGTGNPTQQLAEDAYTVDNLTYANIYGQNYTENIFSGTLNNNDDADEGYNDFRRILECNQIIDNVAASSGISASDKVELIAHGYFLRGITNYYEARAFGKIVWIDTVLTQNEQLRLPTVSSPAQSWHYVIQDLEAAAAGLPTTPTPGLANKYVAEAFLSEACLEAEAYSNYPNGPSFSPGDTLLQRAISSAQDVIANGGYAMDANYGEMFNGGNPNASEIIFSEYFNSVTETMLSTPMQWEVVNLTNGYIQKYGGSPMLNNPGIFQAWNTSGPTQNLAEDYLVVDQNNPSQALPWDSTSQFKTAVSESTRPSLTDIPHNAGETDVQYGIVNPASGQTVWTLSNVGRDARWAASIISDSTHFQGETLTTCILGNATRWMNIFGITGDNSLSNLYWSKGVWTVSPNYFYTTPTNYAFVIMRLGRVYLNLAEAYLLEGDLGDAVAALNQTRTIHGNLPPSTASDLATAWTDYKRERRVDLTTEGDYYWSLLRWGLYGGAANHGNPQVGDIPELDQAPLVMDISKDRMKFNVVTGSFYALNNVRKFDYPRRYLFPIAYTQYILPNPNIVQNPGW
jgi:hypothetical protein